MALALTAVAMQGCAVYVTTPPSEAIQAGEVRVELTPDGADALSRGIGARAHYLFGRAVSAPDSGGLSLAVTTLVRDNGNEEMLGGAVVDLPRASVARVERRQIDRARTAVALTAGVVTAALLGNGIAGGGFRGGGGSSGGTGK